MELLLNLRVLLFLFISGSRAFGISSTEMEPRFYGQAVNCRACGPAKRKHSGKYIYKKHLNRKSLKRVDSRNTCEIEQERFCTEKL